MRALVIDDDAELAETAALCAGCFPDKDVDAGSSSPVLGP